ncbi:hypothetical protein CHELA40_11073 [Chelatococcus asaccharovorans]|nr:hypothetical protein CHELA40_11073 [Chelatococcus asaccharovorans]
MKSCAAAPPTSATEIPIADNNTLMDIWTLPVTQASRLGIDLTFLLVKMNFMCQT